MISLKNAEVTPNECPALYCSALSNVKISSGHMENSFAPHYPTSAECCAITSHVRLLVFSARIATPASPLVTLTYLIQHHADTTFFPNVRELLSVLAVLPLGSCETERSFSCQVFDWLILTESSIPPLTRIPQYFPSRQLRVPSYKTGWGEAQNFLAQRHKHRILAAKARCHNRFQAILPWPAKYPLNKIDIVKMNEMGSIWKEIHKQLSIHCLDIPLNSKGANQALEILIEGRTVGDVSGTVPGRKNISQREFPDMLFHWIRWIMAMNSAVQKRRSRTASFYYVLLPGSASYGSNTRNDKKFLIATIISCINVRMNAGKRLMKELLKRFVFSGGNMKGSWLSLSSYGRSYKSPVMLSNVTLIEENFKDISMTHSQNERESAPVITLLTVELATKSDQFAGAFLIHTDGMPSERHNRQHKGGRKR
ncbi:hypothetical protein GQR58_029246 [Nymphon striatum]|nr:hypothetical protein GQR58_029246 [Nymphon striatum]